MAEVGNDDGFGFLIEKRCRLMKSYGWSEDFVKFGITGAKGWVYYAWAVENESSVWGSNIKRTTKGYVAQEIDKILARKK